MEFICYRQWSELPTDADTLFSQSETHSFFYSRAWFETLTSYALEDTESLLLACVTDGLDLLALLPMKQCEQGSLSSLSNRFTTLFTVLTTDHDKKELSLQCLADGLCQLPNHPIRLEPVDPRDQNIIRLHALLQTHGLKSSHSLRFYNWKHLMNGQTFGEYMQERPARLRNTIERKKRKLQREFNYRIRLFDTQHIEEALDDYQRVYQTSWKANEYHTEFSPKLVQRFSRLGWLRLGVLYANQKAVAAQIWFVAHNKASIYRLVYDEHWKPYSPGSILTQHLMKHVIDIDKVKEIDFLTGNENYKQDWMTIRNERISIVLAKQNKPKSLKDRLAISIKKHLLPEGIIR